MFQETYFLAKVFDNAVRYTGYVGVIYIWELCMQQSWYVLLSKQFKAYPSWAVDLGIFGIVFLILGFLVKSFGRYFFLCLLAVVAALAAAYYFDFAPGFLTELKEFLGLHDMQVLGDIPAIFIAWAREHALACIAAVLGFIVGYTIG